MWMTHLSAEEKALFSSQPTAKMMHEHMLANGRYIKEGDKEATAAVVAAREAAQAKQAGAASDVELSSAGKSLQADAAKAPEAQAASAVSDVQFLGEGASRKLRFTSAEAVHQALKDGYVELNGQQFYLSDDMKRVLTAKDKAMQKLRQGIMNANMLREQAVMAQRQGESMQKSAQAQSRIMETAMRIMKGRKVSTADEKELAQASPDLYKIAKSMGAIEQHKLTRKQKEEDDKISAQHDEDREWEQSPSAIPDAKVDPVPEYSVDVDMPESGGVDIEA
ncbi:hypothetical protein [uncultured Selenomonas sp.]|uniref:hypothetical protein n=1 Tax=uncultured Selenomonas sp. TaxID=159275 RepID=UPI0025D18AD7|nr:hypothetical protein [uncultured Selenomonas sp.]